MKLSELLKKLEEIKKEYGGDLDICVAVSYGDTFEWGDLNYIEVEERTTLNLVAQEEH